MTVEYRKNTGLRVIEVILSLAGLVCLIIGIVLLIKTIAFNNKSEVIEAKIDAVEKNVTTDSDGNQTISYEIYVSYSYNGENFDHVLLSGVNESREVGSLMKVRVNKSYPEDIRYMTSTTFLTILLMVAGLAFFAGFGYIYIGTVIAFNSYKDIVKNGRRVDAVVTRVYPDGTSYNSKNQYYRIDCEWTEKKFTSKAYKNGFDISEGDIVPVYYTSIRRNQYFVDVANVQINKKNKEDNWTFR